MADTTTTSTPPAGSVAGTATPANDAVPGKTEVANKGDAAPSTGLLETVKRYIPGLAATPDQAGAPGAAAAKAKRSRNRGPKKTAAAATTTDIAGAQDPALASALTDHAPSQSELPDSLVSGGAAGEKRRPAALNGSSLLPGTTVGGDEEDAAALEQRKLNPTAAVQKRLRATGKKLVCPAFPLSRQPGGS